MPATAPESIASRCPKLRNLNRIALLCMSGGSSFSYFTCEILTWQLTGDSNPYIQGLGVGSSCHHARETAYYPARTSSQEHELLQDSAGFRSESYISCNLLPPIQQNSSPPLCLQGWTLLKNLLHANDVDTFRTHGSRMSALKSQDLADLRHFIGRLGFQPSFWLMVQRHRQKLEPF